MSQLQLFAITDDGLVALPLPENATSFADLYGRLSLGVYSALRTFEHNKFLDLDGHIARTVRSMRLLGWDYALDEERLRRSLHEACSQFPSAEMRVRFDILAEPATPYGTNSRELIGLLAFSPPPIELYETGVKVGLATDLSRGNPLAKTADFAEARQKYSLGTPEMYERLMVNKAGEILEGTSTNFYGVMDGRLRTAGEGVLEGITRKLLLSRAAELGIGVDLRPIRVEEIPLLEEAAISGSSRALLPVVQIGEQPIGDGKPGQLSRRLLAAYNAYLAENVRTAVG